MESWRCNSLTDKVNWSLQLYIIFRKGRDVPTRFFFPEENVMLEHRDPVELPDLIRRVEGHLRALKYTQRTIDGHKAMWEELTLYAQERGTGAFDTSLGHAFLRDRFELDKAAPGQRTGTQRKAARAVQMLCDFKIHGIVFRRARTKNAEYPAQFAKVFTDCRAALVKRGLAPSTMRQVEIHVRRFAEYLDRKGIVRFSDVSSEDVHGYVLTLSHYVKHTVAYAMYVLRSLFAFAHENGHIGEDLSPVCPRVRYNTKTSIPSAYSREEVPALLSAVDRGNPVGKRDYAILTLAARQGLRVGEIRELEFEHFNWEAHLLEFVQPKTGKQISLPLLPDVGWAVIEYIRHGRPPQADSRKIFVRHHAPYTPFVFTNNMHLLMAKYIRLAKISVPSGKRHGLHALRHSLASALLENNTPMPMISDILNHSSVETTNIYCKIDIANLRECSLEVDDAL
jgi:site-specific recombinase XerD